MKKIKYFFLIIYPIVLAVMCYHANPNFYFIGDNYYDVLNKPPKSPATTFKVLESSCEAFDQYRHNPARTGHTLLGELPPKVKISKHLYPLNVGIHGASKASPVVDDTGIYIGSDTGWFWKYDFDGNKIWSFYAANSKNGFHGTAAVDEKKVYVGAYNGFMYAFDKMTGELSWANPVGNFVGASPLLASGSLYISVETNNPNGLVAKLDCNTGETIWNSEWLGGHSHSSPTYDETTDSILTGANSGRVYSFDNKSGAKNWEIQLGGPIKGTILAKDGIAYMGSWDKSYHALNTSDGSEAWRPLPVGGRIQTSLTLVPEHNLGITNTPIGHLIAIDLKTGYVKWKFEHGDNNHYYSVLVTKNAKKTGSYIVWARCTENFLCSLDAKTGKLLNKLVLPGAFTSVPVAFKNKLYISLVDNHGFLILE